VDRNPRLITAASGQSLTFGILGQDGLFRCASRANKKDRSKAKAM
jgi:hypothetical protein